MLLIVHFKEESKTLKPIKYAKTNDFILFGIVCDRRSPAYRLIGSNLLCYGNTLSVCAKIVYVCVLEFQIQTLFVIQYFHSLKCLSSFVRIIKRRKCISFDLIYCFFFHHFAFY